MINMALKQKNIHKVTEFIGIIAGMYLIYLTKGTELIAEPHNTILFLFGLGNIIVDGILITTWRRK